MVLKLSLRSVAKRIQRFELEEGSKRAAVVDRLDDRFVQKKAKGGT
jgi:hypothetical protein